MIDIAIVVGHTHAAPGARGADGTHEHTWHSELAELLVAELLSRRFLPAVYTRPEGPYEEAMRALTRGINAASPRLVVELHFDSAAGRGWSGSSALHWPASTKGAAAAATLSAAAADAIGIRDRGAIGQGVSHGGLPLRILQWTRAPAVILETHYGDTASDHTAATAARDDGRLPRALAAAIERLLRAL